MSEGEKEESFRRNNKMSKFIKEIKFTDIYVGYILFFVVTFYIMTSFLFNNNNLITPFINLIYSFYFVHIILSVLFLIKLIIILRREKKAPTFGYLSVQFLSLLRGINIQF